MPRVENQTPQNLDFSFVVGDATTEAVARGAAERYIRRYVPDDMQLGYFSPTVRRVGSDRRWRVRGSVSIKPGDDHTAGVDL